MAFAAILTAVLVPCEDVSAIELYFGPRQAVIKQQPNDSRHGDVEIHSGYPVVSVRLEVAPELAYLAPVLEIVGHICVLLERDHLGELAKQQRKCSPGTDYTDGHIMFVQHKDITVKSGFEFTGNHNQQLSS